jgi:hypothetical protein
MNKTIARQHRIPLNGVYEGIHNLKYLQVDGFEDITNTVYEYLGCWYHGCPKEQSCLPYHRPFPDDLVNGHKGKTIKTLRNEWFARKSLLENMGYNVVSIWECEWKNPNQKSLIPQSVTIPTTQIV